MSLEVVLLEEDVLVVLQLSEEDVTVDAKLEFVEKLKFDKFIICFLNKYLFIF
jgi:hypothetical protein